MLLWFHSILCNVLHRKLCHHDAGNTEMPDAMETIFQAALDFGRRGGVSIYFSFACHLDQDSIPAFSW